MPAFVPEKTDVLDNRPGLRGKMAPLWLDHERRSARSNSVVLTGDETTTDAIGEAAGLTVNGDTLRCDNASLLRIHGIIPDTEGGGLGQSLPIVSVGAALVELVPESAVATLAAYRLETVGGLLLRLAPGTGRGWIEYDATSERWRVLLHEQGAPITPTFVAGGYTASSGLWTVGSGAVATMTYHLRGKVLSVAFSLVATTVSATPATLSFTIPGGYTAAATTRTLCELVDNGTPTAGVCQVSDGVLVVTVRRVDGGALAASVGATSVYGQFAFEVKA